MELLLLILSLILLVIELKPKKKIEDSKGNYRDLFNKTIDDSIPDDLTTDIERQVYKDLAKLITTIVMCFMYLLYIIWYMMAYSYIGGIVTLILSTILIIKTLHNIRKVFSCVYGTKELKIPCKIIGYFFKVLDLGYIGYVIFNIINAQ